MPIDPHQVYDAYRKDRACDMWEYMPVLREAARGMILEIGVRGGVSTAAFLCGLEDHGGHLWSVDINPECGKLFEHPQWTFIAGDSRDIEISPIILEYFQRGGLDTLFVDGDHSYEGCFADLKNYGPLVRAAGKIFIHDVTPRLPNPGEETPDWPLTGPALAVAAYLETLKSYVYEVLPGQFGMGLIHVGG